MIHLIQKIRQGALSLAALVRSPSLAAPERHTWSDGADGFHPPTLSPPPQVCCPEHVK